MRFCIPRLTLLSTIALLFAFLGASAAPSPARAAESALLGLAPARLPLAAPPAQTPLGWGDWLGLGGAATSAPSVTSLAPGRLDVFMRGGGGQLLHRLDSDNLALGTSPGIVSRSYGR
ncbi:hypothetical protein EKD04_008290 [Chloroflexales bacterium ZM16-3]|nr:hypothetical protein [Chloroflexales bacterium ZM16-3]